MNKLDSNILWQIAIVVSDIEATARNYAELFGMEMPEILVSGTGQDECVYYNGEYSPAVHKLAFLKMGMLQLELIQPNSAPSTWKDFMEQHGEGIHHIAFFVKDNAQTLEFLEKRGIMPLQKGIFTVGSYNYMDTIDKLGVIVSVSEKYSNMR